MSYLIYSNIRLFVSNPHNWRSDSISFDERKLPEHVIKSLKLFKDFKIIFISKNPHFEKEMLDGINCVKIIKSKNKGFDFDAWKQGLNHIKKQGNLNEPVYFMNDSIFPISDLQDFEKKSKGFDFFGLTYNSKTKKGSSHVQTMLLKMNANIIKSDAFQSFMSQNWQLMDKMGVILNGEIKLTKHLSRAGFSFGYLKEFDSWNSKNAMELPFLKVKGNEGIYNALFYDKKGIDVVYPLSNQSKWDDNELRFSLRSIEKNIKGIRNIIVIGPVKPKWLNDEAIFVYETDPFVSADANITRKVLRAIDFPFLSQKFLFINDDHIVLKKREALKIPYYSKGNLLEHKENKNPNSWVLRALETGLKLQSEGKSTIHYDCHTPIIFDKTKFKEIFSKYYWKKNNGYVMKSIYANNMNVKNVHFKGHKVLFKTFRFSIVELRAKIKGKSFLSYQDSALNSALKFVLRELFPTKSKYENIDIIIKDIEEICDWLQDNNPDYNEGVLLYNRYGKNFNLKKLFQLGERKKTREKLEYSLLNLINK